MEKLIVGNLKMNILSIQERERYIESLLREFEQLKLSESQVVVCPPAVHIESFRKSIENENISIGAQDVFWEQRGSFTGEISPDMLKNLGASFVIIGHSERRNYFAETNETANAKMHAALKNGLSVIYCIGETQAERERGETPRIIATQLTQGLKDIPVSKMSSVIIAYEPVWAVGSDAIPTSNEILEAKILIKKIISELYGISSVDTVRVLYGGSVKAVSAQAVCVQPAMDGVLVGRESLIPREFLKIAEIIDKN